MLRWWKYRIYFLSLHLWYRMKKIILRVCFLRLFIFTSPFVLLHYKGSKSGKVALFVRNIISASKLPSGILTLLCLNHNIARYKKMRPTQLCSTARNSEARILICARLQTWHRQHKLHKAAYAGEVSCTNLPKDCRVKQRQTPWKSVRPSTSPFSFNLLHF